MSEAEINPEAPLLSLPRSERDGIGVGVVRGAYAERKDEPLSKTDELGLRLAAPLMRRIKERRGRFSRVPALVAEQAAGLHEASEDEVRQATAELRASLSSHGYRDDLVARAFAIIREVSSRTIGLAHFDVQLIGGWVMLHGLIAEMQTGEGKTLAATLPACTAALAGVPVHVITVNDYLAKRDAETLAPIYAFLGLTVGVIVSGMEVPARRAAYACDIAYCTNKEVAFDYLKDRIVLGGHPTRRRLALEALTGGGRAAQLIHRGLRFAIVDEADSVLIDEARTPLIIAQREHNTTEEAVYRTAVEAARELDPEVDFTIDEQERQIKLTEEGRIRTSELLEEEGGLWRGRRRREEFIRQALSALHLFHLDLHYLVRDDGVQIIDEYTGRVMADRSWEHGLHQMIEVKEGVTLSGRQDTLARISYQRFFSRYHRLCGMTGTAREVAPELWQAYRIAVVTIPTNRPSQRVVLPERVFASAHEKWDAVVARIGELHALGRPVLVGTRSVASSEHLSALLEEAGLEHRVLNARQDAEEAEIVLSAGLAGCITVATNMAGRGTDIELGEGVAALGGLHVVSTERHDAARIDRQLSGRAARQGDAGSCESIVSLEDELVSVHAPRLVRALADRAAAWGSGAGVALLGRLALTRAQRRAGRLHARIRRDLLKSDTQLDTMLAFSGRPD